MDGVLWHEGKAIAGAPELIQKWTDADTKFLVLTNNSIYTQHDLSIRLQAGGLNVPKELIYTSALATADFLAHQSPKSSAYVIGENGLISAMHDIGYVLTESNPEYVVLGETRNLSFDSLTKAARFINNGAKFIATNPDPTGPSKDGVMLATG